MALQVNDPLINKYLITIVGSDKVRIANQISITQQFDEFDVYSSINAGHYVTVTRPPLVEMTVQMLYAISPNPLDREFDFHKLEQRLSTAVNVMDGRVMRRSTTRQGFDGMLAEYTVQLPSYEESIEKLHQYALTQVDREFTEVLETKLSES